MNKRLQFKALHIFPEIGYNNMITILKDLSGENDVSDFQRQHILYVLPYEVQKGVRLL
jgi:hypothetical protein